jgi:hypothetical protein
MFNLRGPTRADPKDHLWSADHSLRNGAVDIPFADRATSFQ